MGEFLLHLEDAVRTGFGAVEGHTLLAQFPFSGVHVGHVQGKVRAPGMRLHGIRAIPDQVQFLVGADAEPGAGKVERRPRHGLQVQDLPVKSDALRHIGNVQGYVVNGLDLHETGI